MRSVGMGTMPEDVGKKLLDEISELKAENAALKQEIAELKSKKTAQRGKTKTASVDDPASE